MRPREEVVEVGPEVVGEEDPPVEVGSVEGLLVGVDLVEAGLLAEEVSVGVDLLVGVVLQVEEGSVEVDLQEEVGDASNTCSCRSHLDISISIALCISSNPFCSIWLQQRR